MPLDSVMGILERGLLPGGEGEEGEGSGRGHVYFQRVSPESPEYRPGSRTKCDVQVYVNHEHLMQQLPCYITHSGCVVTPYGSAVCMRHGYFGILHVSWCYQVDADFQLRFA